MDVVEGYIGEWKFDIQHTSTQGKMGKDAREYGKADFDLKGSRFRA